MKLSCSIALGLAIAIGLGSTEARAAETLKLGTLAPPQSPWGQVYKVWQAAVREKSEGRLELQVFYSGQQGDEAAMVAKVRTGQLDAAAVTAVGLARIHKPVLALQMPGLFRTWAKLDTARDALRGELEKGIADAGFTLGGWGDVGRIHGMSKGFAVRVPEDLRGHKPATWRDDVIGPVVFQIVGGVTPVPLSVPEILPSLGTGAIDVLSAPSLAAEQLQWTSRLDHISEEATLTAIGALVFSTRRLGELPADLRTILQETGKVAGAALSTRIRKEDDAAFARLRKRMTVVSVTDAERSRWAALFRQVAERLSQGTFSPDLVARLGQLAK